MQHKGSLDVPDTEATRLLKAINVRPEQQIELAKLPTAAIEAAIADGRAREGIRDLAGWVVSLLRAHRDYGWTITPPAPRPDSPEALQAAFVRYAVEVEQEAARHAGMGDEHAWFPAPSPALLNLPGALTRLWNEIQAAIKLQATRVEFNTWIRRAVLHAVEGGVATIVVPNALVKEGIEHRFLSQLCDLLAMHVGEPIEVRVILNGAQQEDDGAVAPDRDPTPASRSTQPHPLPEPAADPALRPDWIGVEQWESLSTLLRAALIGSTQVDGRIQAASPYLDRLLRARYACEVEALIAGGDADPA